MSGQEPGGKFDPTRYLRQLHGRGTRGGPADYLDIKWRLVWLRSEHPDARIETEHVTITNDQAIFKAVVAIPGGGSASGYGSETARDFGDYIEKAECVPLRSECLTRAGFKRFDELVVGEDVLAYDVDTDRFHWTPLRAVTVHETLPMVTLSNNQGFSVDCTPDHSWAIRRWTSRENQRREVSELREARRLTKMDWLILTAGAPAPGGNHLLTPVEAAILGWMVTDGTLQARAGTRRIALYQSKPATVELIQRLVPEAHEVITRGWTRAFPTSRTDDTLPQSQFILRAERSAALLDKAGLTSLEMLPSLVTRLSQPARAAMLEAMMLAEADARGNFAQRPGPVLTAFQMLAILEGKSVGKAGNPAGTDLIVQRLKRRRFVSASQFSLTPLGPRPAWCPTTDYGTWVMRQDGRVLITGNTKALGRALAALGYGTQFARDFEDEEARGLPGNEPTDPIRARPLSRPESATGTTPSPPRPEPIPADTRRAGAIRPLREPAATSESADAPVATGNGIAHATETSTRATASAKEHPATEPSAPPVKLSAAQPAARPTPRPAPAAAARADETESELDVANYGWTEFWSWARSRGYTDRKSLDAVVGRSTAGMTPLEIRRQIQARQTTNDD